MSWNESNVPLYQVSYRNKDFTIPVLGKDVTLTWPAHYVIITGFVSVRGRFDNDVCETTGRLRGVTEIHMWDWKTTVWDLNFSKTTKSVYFNMEVTDASKYDNKNVTIKWLGRISEEARDNNAWIRARAAKIVADMNGEYQGVLKKGGGYRKYFNNCRNFKSYLYQEIKY